MRLLDFSVRKVLLLLTVIIINYQNGHTQNLLTSRKSSFYTYLYKLTDKEAEQVYKNYYWQYTQDYFHTLIDSFPTDSTYDKKLPSGHYFKTFANRNKQEIEILSVQPFNAYILNNSTDLNVQIVDETGQTISNAEVSLGNKSLKYTKKIHCYSIRKSNNNGLLKVVYQGNTAYFDLKKDYKNSWVKRAFIKSVWGTPLKYAWRPVRYTYNLPIDGVKSIVRRYPRGTIYKTKNFFVKAYEKTACLLDKTNCEYYNIENKFQNYVVFNKPMYKPQDSVKLKGYIAKKNGKPIKKELTLVLFNAGKEIELSKIKPYRPGGYVYRFKLDDSLNLKLETHYSLHLKNKKGQDIVSSSFLYKDYELKSNNLTLKLSSKKLYNGDSLELLVKGTDANELNLKDANVKMLLRTQLVTDYFDKYVFVPDSLYYTEKKLENQGETRLVVPASAFPKANFSATVVIQLLTSDNESVEKQDFFNFNHQSKTIDMALETDSLWVSFKQNGLRKESLGKVFARDILDKDTLIYEGVIPIKLPLNPYYKSYRTIAEDNESEIYIDHEQDMLQCFANRTSNQVKIQIDNPRNLYFHYDIFKHNNRVENGYVQQLDFTKKDFSNIDYYIFLNYMWGGKIKQQTYRIAKELNQLKIQVIQPEMVFPGQKTNVRVSITDFDGKPVKNADITAFGLTKKFNYNLSDIPEFPQKIYQKDLINQFGLKYQRQKKLNDLKLEYSYWKNRMRLDSIAYYQFTYPQDKIYRFQYNATDSITQFAPFMFKDGEGVPIHVVYLDSKPVYFDWNTNLNPYSVAVTPGYHHVTFRTGDQEILIDSIYFEKGKKLIFSINDSLELHSLSRYKRTYKWTEQEQKFLYPYIFPYKNKFFPTQYAYLKNVDNYFLLNPLNNRSSVGMTGPVSGFVYFKIKNDFDNNFFHEPYFEYDFNEDWLKMREKKDYPKYFNRYNKNTSIFDEVLTENKIAQIEQEAKNQKRIVYPRYNNPFKTTIDNGTLVLKYRGESDKDSTQPLNIIISKTDDPLSFRCYEGSNTVFYDLKPGNYKVTMLFQEGFYFVTDELLIKPNGINLYQCEIPQKLVKDDYSVKMNKLIEDNVLKISDAIETKKEILDYQNLYYNQNFSTVNGFLIQGIIEDESGPLPGVSVLIKGTSRGTETDFDGHYSIYVNQGDELVFSYVGMESKEMQVNGSQVMNVNMKSSTENLLEEVVVTAYGFSGQKKNLSFSATNVLSGRVAGLQIEKASGITGSSQNIVIRGMSSMPNDFSNKALVVINGVPFEGDLSQINVNIIKELNIVNDSSAVAIYGSRAANGVILITTDQTGLVKQPQNKGVDFNKDYMLEVMQQNSIRSNFSDSSFWEPKLITDANGKVSFSMTYPDDITAWDNHFIAVNGTKTGTLKTTVKSIKPLLSQIFMPRFLVEGDSLKAVGKSSNYLPDSIKVSTRFEINGVEKFTRQAVIDEILVDSLPIAAVSDTLKIKYSMQTVDGYMDGELRDLPVYPLGIEKIVGNFYVLDKDTLIQTNLNPAYGKVKMYFRNDVLDVLRDEIDQIKYYKYDCNEQMGSKLKAFLAEQRIQNFLGEKFRHDNEVEKLIRKLNRNQNSQHLWGWWQVDKTTPWISLHVLEALLGAEQMGYKIDINKSEITQTLVWMFDNSSDFEDKLRMVKAAALLKVPVDFDRFIQDLQKQEPVGLHQELIWMELMQILGKDFDKQILFENQESTLFGNIYFKDKNDSDKLHNNEIQNTLLVYRILQRDSILANTQSVLLQKMRNYFLEKKNSGYWANTYESIQILETVLPDILKKDSDIRPSEVEVSGDFTKKITSFPYEIVLDSIQKIQIQKTGSTPVYMSVSQKYWEKTPQYTANDFEVDTKFGTNETTLTAGQEVTLVATVHVKKPAEYVMINIPIPSGCSYADSNSKSHIESHRESFKNETVIFCQDLEQGTYQFKVKLNPRYSGTYSLNPAQVKLMYFPTFNANNEIKKVKIQ